MRINGPVTNAEYVLSDDEVIITHTDPGGRITYANAAFIRSSEFSPEECIGQPHNIVRHPDMPQEAFADLWDTLRTGEPWVGIIKNRRKGGGFYWVRANITPILEHGRVAGYMSVRVKATQEEIHTAAATYATLRNGASGSIGIRRGRFVSSTPIGRLRALLRPTLGTGNWLVVGAMSLLFSSIILAALLERTAAAALLGTLGLAVALANMLYIHSRVVRPIQRLRATAARIVGGDTLCRFATVGDGEIEQLATALNQLSVKISGVLKDTCDAIAEMSAGAHEVVAANTQLSQRTNDHAAGIEETAAALDEMTASVSRNTASAQQSSHVGDGRFRRDRTRPRSRR